MNLKFSLTLLAVIFSCYGHSQNSVDSVKRIIAKRYEDLAKVSDEQDMKKILSFKTDDFHTLTPDGRVNDHIAMEEHTRRFVTNNIPPFNIKFTILNLRLSSNRIVAVVDVLQESTRTRNIDNIVRRIMTRVVQTETWVYVNNTWKLKMVDDVRDQETFVDGRRVDPTKPYNPADPPFQRNTPTSLKQLEWLQGNWKGMANNAPFYEAWRKFNDSVLVNFRIEIKGTDTIVQENGAVMLTSRFKGYKSKSATWELVSLSDQWIVLGNDTLKYANIIVWSHSPNDHWLTEIRNPQQTIYYDLERVPWLEEVVNTFIRNSGRR